MKKVGFLQLQNQRDLHQMFLTVLLETSLHVNVLDSLQSKAMHEAFDAKHVARSRVLEGCRLLEKPSRVPDKERRSRVPKENQYLH